MLFDTDILIWALRGNNRAANLVDQEGERLISNISYMELLQRARDKNESRIIKSFLSDNGFLMVPLSENIWPPYCDLCRRIRFTRGNECVWEMP